MKRSADHRGASARIVALRAAGLAWAALLCCAGAAQAADPVYKCSTADGVAYQGVPCDGVPIATQHAFALAPSPPAVLSTRGTGGQPAVCTARPGATSRGLWRRDALCLGITDDEVLNLPAWGKPAAVDRVRVRGGWREAWRYASAAGRNKRLSFLNGRLENVDDGPDDAPEGAAVRVSAMDVR